MQNNQDRKLYTALSSDGAAEPLGGSIFDTPPPFQLPAAPSKSLQIWKSNNIT